MNTDVRDLRILVVDDDPDDAELMLRALRASPMVEASAVHTVPSAQRVLAEGGADLVVLDLYMPGHDGFEMLEWMADHHPHTMVLVVTGSSLGEDRERALALGAKRVAVKPTTRDDFERFMRTLDLDGLWMSSLIERME